MNWSPVRGGPCAQHPSHTIVRGLGLGSGVWGLSLGLRGSSTLWSHPAAATDARHSSRGRVLGRARIFLRPASPRLSMCVCTPHPLCSVLSVCSVLCARRLASARRVIAATRALAAAPSLGHARAPHVTRPLRPEG